MPDEKARGYVSKIQFNGGEVINIKQNDIIVFVGPNNVGKSQSLEDIYNLCGRALSGIVISKIEITKNAGKIKTLLDSVSIGQDGGTIQQYRLFGQTYNYYGEQAEKDYQNSNKYGFLLDWFVAKLNTEARLLICKPAESITRKENKTNAIHYAAFDAKYRKWLSDSFKKAFGSELTPDILYGRTIPLCIGPSSVFQGERDAQECLEEYAETLAGYKQVQEQGDGIKSFTGILLYLMLDYYCTYLIDEPESFLHPPQAKIMGHIIGETLSDKQQAFISTHSEEIVQGLLEACPERIKIIRITRTDNKNSISVLDNEKMHEVWRDPLLRYSNIMDSLFHKFVVLCESESDCKMYSIIENHIKQKEGKYSETLYIHCGGKQRMAKIASALLSLGVELKLIPDMDVLNDETVFRGITDAFGIKWELLDRDYKIIISDIRSAGGSSDKNTIKTVINQILDSSPEPYLTRNEQQQIRAKIRTISKWDEIKQNGVPAIPAGNASASYRRLNAVLQQNGIYIVPVGQLEGFVKEIGLHGPEWVNTVIETYPDFDAEEYRKICAFINTVFKEPDPKTKAEENIPQ